MARGCPQIHSSKLFCDPAPLSREAVEAESCLEWLLRAEIKPLLY